MLSDLASLATALAVVVGVIEIYRARMQSVTEFEDSLAAEYRALANAMPIQAFLGQKIDFDLDDCKALDEFYHYFDLCNNQIFLRQIGRVQRKTWLYWRDGIKSNMERPAFAEAWARIEPSTGKDFEELKKLIRMKYDEDPKDWP